MINIEDFSKIELKVGTILAAEALPNSQKLIKLMIDLGEEKPRQILAGIREWYKPKTLVGKQVIVVANLEPKVMMGLESSGMILCADPSIPSAVEGLRTSIGKPIFLKPFQKVPPGTKVR